MKILLILVLAGLCMGNVTAADRFQRGRMKGWELYSWKEQGRWAFVLLGGTNRLKSEDEVKGSADRVDAVTALARRFKELAKEERVVWNFHRVPGFSFPDEKTFSEIVAAAKSARINLIPDPGISTAP